MSILVVVGGDAGVRYNFQLYGGTGGWELLDITTRIWHAA